MEDNFQYSADLLGLADKLCCIYLCRIHTTPVVREFFDEQRVEVMEWVAQSLDFNPIENLLSYLDSNVPITERINKKRFEVALMKTWNEIPLDYLQKLVKSVPNRFLKTIKSRGHPIGY